MGRRSSTETVVALVSCFIEERTWTQADLARALDLDVKTVKRRLVELEAHGIPLDRDGEPPHVCWSVPNDWLPGALTLRDGDARELLRQLMRAPRTKKRDDLARRLVQALPKAALPVERDAVVVPLATAQEEVMLSMCEDAAAAKVPVKVRYFSVRAGDLSERHLSVHRVVVTPPRRCAATDHRSGELRWFRVDRMERGEPDASTAFRAASLEDIDAFVQTSVDGFREAGPAHEVTFVVKEPASKWASRNLVAPMIAEPIDGGIRVRVTAAALVLVARFVVGLGDAAVCESPELAAVVRALAKGALAANAERREDGS